MPILLSTCVATLLAVGCASRPGAPDDVEDAAKRNSPFVGQPAPAFTLPNALGRDVALDDYRGRWVVIYFYPADDTPGCVCQATEFTELLGEFHRLDADVVGISPDTPASHRRFAKKYDLEINLLSDAERRVMTRYGAWTEVRYGQETTGRVIRSTVIVGPDGVVRDHWPSVVPRGHAERVQRRLRQLQEG
jgi:peroxiredoxin Q/BCP